VQTALPLLRRDQNDVCLSFRCAVLKRIIQYGNCCPDLRGVRNASGSTGLDYHGDRRIESSVHERLVASIPAKNNGWACASTS